jgi:predicted O-linked N-acetylglucosamine transferase (SPINDLY family)
MRLGRPDDALAACDQGLVSRPQHPGALLERGNALAALKRYDEALASYDAFVAFGAVHPDAFNNRGNVLSLLGRHRDALDSYGRALALQPDHLDALNNRANALRALERWDEAIESYNKVLAVAPDHADALYNRGHSFYRLQRYRESLADIERFLARQPDDPEALDTLASCKRDTCDWSNAADLFAKLRACVSRGGHIEPFTFLLFGAEPRDQFECGRVHLTHKLARSIRAFAQPSRPTGQRLRLAYLSSDFRVHPVGYSIAALIEAHDRNRFEIIGVSLSPGDGSDIQDRLTRSFDRFVDATSLGDEQVATLLHDEHIDIAIDVNGHTGNSRPAILAHRPAPVQVNFLGFAGTTAADFLDYIVADHFVLPRSQQPHYSEQIVHLPDCYFPASATPDLSPVSVSRSAAGLPGSGFVFCAFNSLAKLNREFFSVWMRLLKQTDGSVLWLSRVNDLARSNLERGARAAGVDFERIVFAQRLDDRNEHLARYRLADLFLDTLPFNAHSTAYEALSAGLPVLTCAGTTFAGRVAGSMLHAAGAPELVTENLAQYEALALNLVRAPDTLHGIRRGLAERRSSCALFDPDRFRRHIESAYVSMWEAWQRGERPQGFAVEPAN